MLEKVLKGLAVLGAACLQTTLWAKSHDQILLTLKGGARFADPQVAVQEGDSNKIDLRNYNLRLEDTVVQLGEDEAKALTLQQFFERIKGKVILTHSQLEHVKCRQYVQVVMDKNLINPLYKKHIFSQLRQLAKDLPNDVVLVASFRKLERGKSFEVSVVEQELKAKQLAEKGYATHTYRRIFEEPLFTAAAFKQFYQNSKAAPFSERGQSSRYRFLMNKGSSQSLSFQKGIIFLYSNNCDSCKRLTPNLESLVKSGGYSITRVNYNRNYPKQLKYFPFTPVLLAANQGSLFLFQVGNMSNYYLRPFLENTQLLKVIDDQFLEQLPSLPPAQL